MIKEQVKPSGIDISNHLIGSNLNNSEKETIARNIILIGQKNGDKWPEITFAQYGELCTHKVTDSEESVLNALVSMGFLSCDNGVYRVLDKFIVTLWDFVSDELKD